VVVMVVVAERLLCNDMLQVTCQTFFTTARTGIQKRSEVLLMIARFYLCLPADCADNNQHLYPNQRSVSSMDPVNE
jgi:hypothetical protein